MRYLRPGTDEMRRLALRETDPTYAASFDPITKGPLAAFGILALVVAAAVVVSPVRLVMNFFRRDRA